MMKPNKLVILAALVLAFALFYQLELHQWLAFDTLQQSQRDISAWVEANTLLAIAAYGLLYIGVTALSLPGAIPLSLLGGALFGTLAGTVIVSFASTGGATLAFLVARHLLRDTITQRFSNTLTRINTGLKNEGVYYLLTLRLIPLVPFAAINLAMGLTRMPARTFYWVSQLGMLPATLIIVNTGTQLATLESTADILTPAVLLSLTALGCLPLIGRALQQRISLHQRLRNFTKPTTFDRNLIVIGGGAAGLVSALIATSTRARVTLIEKDRMGGECLNTGCVPSKALIRSARFIAAAQQASRLGIRHAQTDFDFADIMTRVHNKIAAIAPHDSVERFSALGVDCRQGSARLISPWEVEINGETLSARHIILATGSRPHLPAIAGIEQVPVLTNENIWQLTTLPKRLLVIGAGAIGCELGQCFARFGSAVTLVQQGSHILNKEDPDIAQYVSDQLQQDGIQILTEHHPLRFTHTHNEYQLHCRHNNTEQAIAFDQVLIATGRTPNLSHLGLEALGFDLSTGTLAVDAQLRTQLPSILACGDIIGPHRFTHAASHQAWYASVNALFGQLKSFAVDYRHIPFTLYCDPEIARIGLNERMAMAQNVAYEVTEYDLSALDRAITDDTARGKIKVLTPPGKDKILGVTIVGDMAGEMIAEFALAMKHGLGLGKILGTLHPYPTLNEANRFVAGQWRKAHTSETLLNLLEHYHRWRR